MGRIKSCLTLAAAVLTIGLSQQADAKTVWKFNTLLTPESELGQSVQLFVDQTTALSKGELEIQVFYRGELGKNIPVVMQSLMAGDLDGFIESGNYFGSLDKRFNVLDAPYAFKSRKHFQAFMKTPVWKDMTDTILSRGIKIINSDKMNWFRSEDRAVLMRHPVITPEDLAKQKIRQYQAEMPIQGLIAIGANVQVVPWPDVYTAIMTGTVDGLETVLSQSVQNKHVEGAKFHTILELYYQQAYIMVSSKAWDALTPELQNAVSEASTAGGEMYQRLSREQGEKFEEIARRDYGVTVIRPPLAPFQELVAEAQQDWIKRGLIPGDVMKVLDTLEY